VVVILIPKRQEIFTIQYMKGAHCADPVKGSKLQKKSLSDFSGGWRAIMKV
jgi:hypothetical protein